MNIHYFIDSYPLPFVPHAVKIIEVALVAGVVASGVLWTEARRARHNPPKKRLLRRLLRWCVSVVVVTLVLFFFRQQRVYILAMPALALVVYGGFLAWLGRIVIGTIKTMPEEERQWRDAETRKKYLQK